MMDWIKDGLGCLLLIGFLGVLIGYGALFDALYQPLNNASDLFHATQNMTEAE